MSWQSAQEASRQNRRVTILDEVRGLFIVLMVFYHGCYNLVEIFSIDFPLFYSKPMQVLQLFIAGDLIWISGAACRFSRNNRKRGLQVFGWAMVLTLVTYFVLPSQTIRFGVLHCLGVSMVVFSLLQPCLDRLRPWAGLLLLTVLFLGTYYVASGYIGFPPFLYPLPEGFYCSPYLFWLGFPNQTFTSSDYFPLLPWLFFFLAGSFFGVWAKEGRLPPWCYQTHSRLLTWVGRRALVIYLLHQPILYGAMLALFMLLR